MYAKRGSVQHLQRSVSCTNHTACLLGCLTSLLDFKSSQVDFILFKPLSLKRQLTQMRTVSLRAAGRGERRTHASGSTSSGSAGLQAPPRLVYKHGFHAGCFQDVMKHSVIVLLLARMCEKPSPFTYVETHAGAGRYDLEAALPQEISGGIKLLQSDDCTTVPPEASTLLRLLDRFAEGSKQYYPGSPLVAVSQCRPQDTVVLCEFAADQHELLTSVITEVARVHQNLPTIKTHISPTATRHCSRRGAWRRLSDAAWSLWIHPTHLVPTRSALSLLLCTCVSTGAAHASASGIQQRERTAKSLTPFGGLAWVHASPPNSSEAARTVRARVCS